MTAPATPPKYTAEQVEIYLGKLQIALMAGDRVRAKAVVNAALNDLEGDPYKPENIYDMPVSELAITTRLINCLMDTMMIDTVRQLLQRSPADMLNVWGYSEDSQTAIVEAVKEILPVLRHPKAMKHWAGTCPEWRDLLLKETK